MGDQSLSGSIANLINRLSDKSLILGIYVGFIVFIRLLHVFVFFVFFASCAGKEGRERSSNHFLLLGDPTLEGS